MLLKIIWKIKNLEKKRKWNFLSATLGHWLAFQRRPAPSASCTAALSRQLAQPVSPSQASGELPLTCAADAWDLLLQYLPQPSDENGGAHPHPDAAAQHAAARARAS
jgi:hypothetical protein